MMNRINVPLADFENQDLDTALEDHVADEWRYLCMARPIAPGTKQSGAPKALRWGNPLESDAGIPR